MKEYRLSLKVSTKGAVSVYGMGRFPVTLYGDQWMALLDKCEAIAAFIKANQASLKAKPENNGGPEGSTEI